MSGVDRENVVFLKFVVMILVENFLEGKFCRLDVIKYVVEDNNNKIILILVLYNIKFLFLNFYFVFVFIKVF